MKIEITGTGTVEDIINSLESSLKCIKAMQLVKVRLDAKDEDLACNLSDDTCIVLLTK